MSLKTRIKVSAYKSAFEKGRLVSENRAADSRYFYHIVCLWSPYRQHNKMNVNPKFHSFVGVHWSTVGGERHSAVFRGSAGDFRGS